MPLRLPRRLLGVLRQFPEGGLGTRDRLALTDLVANLRKLAGSVIRARSGEGDADHEGPLHRGHCTSRCARIEGWVDSTVSCCSRPLPSYRPLPRRTCSSCTERRRAAGCTARASPVTRRPMRSSRWKGGAYGALVGAQVLIFDGHIQHRQYINGDGLTTWTQFGIGLSFGPTPGNSGGEEARQGRLHHRRSRRGVRPRNRRTGHAAARQRAAHGQGLPARGSVRLRQAPEQGVRYRRRGAGRRTATSSRAATVRP